MKYSLCIFLACINAVVITSIPLEWITVFKQSHTFTATVYGPPPGVKGYSESGVNTGASVTTAANQFTTHVPGGTPTPLTSQDFGSGTSNSGAVSTVGTASTDGSAPVTGTTPASSDTANTNSTATSTLMSSNNAALSAAASSARASSNAGTSTSASTTKRHRLGPNIIITSCHGSRINHRPPHLQPH